ncbi:MAG: helix-turn-helix transcriptional regulator [Micavibrio sp.]|nr:helix-turn-helix transcriptional regulator [Micavibrio sp.]
METKTKNKPKSKKKPSKKKVISKKIPKIKIWLMEKGVNQKDLAQKTELSTNTINRFVNKGKASKSVIKLISYELGVSFEELNKLLEDSEPVAKQ